MKQKNYISCPLKRASTCLPTRASTCFLDVRACASYTCKHVTCSYQGWAGIPVPVHSQEWKPLIPFPELWEWIFSFPSRSRISGMLFFHSLPVPELWEFFFSFPSRSRIVGIDFFHSLPVHELWECIFFIPFPFPNLLFHRQESKRELDYCKR